MKPKHLTTAEKVALREEVTLAVNRASLAIGKRYLANGTCFDCFIQSECIGLAASLAAGLALWLEDQGDAFREQRLTETLATLKDVVEIELAARDRARAEADAGGSVVH